MAMPHLQEAETPCGVPIPSVSSAQRVLTTGDAAAEYPVREYIAGMARELAQMARWDGDEVLAILLDGAVSRAEAGRP